MSYEIKQGDSLTLLRTMADCSVDCCITSPPYWGLRDYGVAGQIGLEATPEEFVARLVDVFREVRRVLKDDGTCWVNLGDSYASSPASGGSQSELMTGGEHKRTPRVTYVRPSGLKPKDLCGIPWRVAFALQADGWWLRQDIIWHKPNPMPESVRDRCTKAHEYVFLLTKSAKYFWDAGSMKEPGSGRIPGNKTPCRMDASHGTENTRLLKAQQLPQDTRNKRSVWTLATQPTPEAHFATYPLELPEICLLAGSVPGGIILDPFNGAGTTGLAAIKNGRRYIGLELNPEYVEITHQRFQKYMPLLAEATCET